MATYEIDRSLLESKSTEEISRILRDEREDYTPEAIRILEQILESRNVKSSSSGLGNVKPPGVRVEAYQDDREPVRTPGDAVRELNYLFAGVMNGTIDPQVGQVASNIVMGILRAMEMEFMQEPEESS